MTDLVGVASNAVAAYQRALATVSNNIANVATDGYSRQAVVLQANPVSKNGNIFMGTGVMVDRIQRQYDAFAEANLRNSNSDLASQEPMVSYANRVIDVMGGQTMGLASALDQFFAAARDLSADPASTVVRGSFVRDAQGLAARFGQLSSQLDLVPQETSQAISSSVSQMNTIIKQLAEVNGQLTANRTANAQPSALLDQRDRLLKDLSDFARVNTRFNENGSVLVSLGPEVTKDIVVDGDKAFNIGANFDARAPEKVTLVLDPYGQSSSLSGFSSGKLAGLMAFREQVLGSTRAALDTLAGALVREVNAVHQQGVDGYGQAAGALFSIDPAATSVAAGLRVAFEDPMRVSAAAQFRVIEDPSNVGGADATLSYDEASAASLPGPPALPGALVNNAHPSAARAVNVSGSLPVAGIATVANGMQDVSIYLDNVQAGQQLQVLTRDGRQLIGQSMADNNTLLGQLITTSNGFADGAGYSAAYLNVNGGTASYKGMTVFYGAQAQVQQQPLYNSKDQVTGSKAFPALLLGGRLQASSTGIGATALVLNGVALGALADPGTGSTLQAGAVVQWINAKTAQTGVTATASNEIGLDPGQLKYGLPLSINGTLIDTSAATTVSSLARTINDRAAAVSATWSARISPDGQLVISNAGGADISIAATNSQGSSAANALGLTSGTFRGQISLTQPLQDGSGADITRPIQIGFGSSGTPSDLAKLGFRTGAFINGAVKDDLLVFVTGAGKASVSASYAGTAVNAKQALRAQPMTVRFTSDTHYKITDTLTGTVVAERTLDPAHLNPAISYQGLQLALTSAPKSGDMFTLDGNVDGTGNNENMLALLALERKPLIGNKTLGAAYIDHINEMGNIARQATIAKAALTVVHDQAVSTRDQVSGVSLDQEAADLIRFQQAYQASAKILQVASQLFDTILQVR